MNNKIWGSILLITGAMIAGCDHRVEMTTVIDEDGKIDKTITLTEVDSSQVHLNYLGISPETGWAYEIRRVPSQDEEPDSSGKPKTDMQIIFSKHFENVNEVNAELNRDSDTLFQIESQLEKKFRWFYTYLKYSETFKKADRFRMIKRDEYFTPEEYAFIERMPARGSKVSPSDSLYAEALNKKIFDQYSLDAILEEHFEFMRTSFKKYGLPEDAAGKLEEKRPAIVEILTEEEQDDDSFMPMDDDLMLIELVDSLVVKLPRPEIDRDYKVFNEEFERRLNFMSWVSDGTFTNNIEVPWTLVETNADSVSGNRLRWEPPLMKFLLTDYTMHATTRKMNMWAVVVSILIVGLTIFMFIRKR